MALMDSVNGLLGRVSDPRVSGGLLALGSSLLQGRGNLAQSLGQGAQQLQQFNANYDQNQQEQQFQQGRQQLQQQQLAQGQYQQEQQAAQAQRMAQIREALQTAPDYIQQIAQADPEAALKLYGEIVQKRETANMEPYTLSEGGVRYGPDGKVIARNAKTFAPQAPQRETFGAPIETVGPDGRPALIQMGSLGGVRPVGGGYAPKAAASGSAGQATVEERKAAMQYGAVRQALDVVERLVKGDPAKGVVGNPDIGTPTALQNSLRVIPFVGDSLAEATKPEDQRQYDQAIATSVDMIIRATSGANAPEPEVQRKKQEVTPSYLDSPAVKAQKLATLQNYANGIKTTAGRALPQDQQTNAYGMPPANFTVGGKRPPLSSFGVGR